MGLIFAAESLDGSEKLLLLALTNYTDPHGYCWPSEARLADDCGTSRSTVQRTKRKLAARNLIKSVRRVNPRTGEPISNLTRVNLPLLASMARSRSGYDDDLISAITFEDDSQGDPAGTLAGTPDDPRTTPDLLKGQSDSYPASNRSLGRVNMTPTPSQIEAQSLKDPVVEPSSPLPPGDQPSTPTVPRRGGGGGEASPEEEQAAAVFVDALPYGGRLPGPAQRATLIRRAAAAFAAGWTPATLHRQLTTGTAGAKSLPHVYAYRLEPEQLPDPAAAAADRPVEETPTPPAFRPEPPRPVVPASEGAAAVRAALRAQPTGHTRSGRLPHHATT